MTADHGATPSAEPEVTVLVPSFQGATRLPLLLDSLERQEIERTWEVLVVVDGSTDETVRLLTERAVGLPQLRVMVLPENVGRPAALNAGFANARGSVVIRCDDDLVLPPRYVDGHAAWHEGLTDRGVIGLPRAVYPPSAYATSYGIPADGRFAQQAYARRVGERWVHWGGSCSVRRTTWETVGAYSADFRERGEDFEWGYRLAQAGAELVLDPELEVLHHYSGTTVEKRVTDAFLTGQAEARLRRRHAIVPVPPPSPASLRGRVWSTLIRIAALPGSRRTYRSAGAVADHILPRLPARRGYQLVSFLIEAAAAGGKRSDELGALRSQRSR